MDPCPLGQCDGSGFLFDAETRTARACACRPQRIARRKARALAGRVPARYRDVAFEREPVLSIERSAPTTVKAAKDFCRRIDENLAAGRGLLFRGDVGTGKTTLAMLISKAAMSAGHSVAIYSLPRLLAVLRATYDDDAEYSLNELIDRLCEVDLLHIDDVGTEQSSEWVLEQLYTIVNTRYEEGRSLVLTTNLEEDALAAQLHPRTVSRLKEMCEELPLYGEDRRQDASIRMPIRPYGHAA
jgi:DNA replication protein DnaC